MAELSMRRNVYSVGDFGFGGFQTPTGSMNPVGLGSSTLTTLLNAVPSIIGAFRRPASPAPMMFGSGQGSLLGGAIQDVRNMFSPGVTAGPSDFYRESPARMIPRQRIDVPSAVDPMRIDSWQYAGRPILWSRDLAAKRRVEKVARLAARGGSRRRTRRFRR